jgi:addiction module HigA family antidote
VKMAAKVSRAKLRNRLASRKVVTSSLAPISPGELLEEEFMIPMDISAYRLAKEIDVSATRIGEILNGKRSITADTDLRLCKFFGLSNGYWLRAQAAFDMEIVRVDIAKDLMKIKPWKHSMGKSSKK